MVDDVEEVDDGNGGMCSSLETHYALGADIDASPSWSEGAAGCGAYDGTDIATTSPCAGWVPLPRLQWEL